MADAIIGGTTHSARAERFRWTIKNRSARLVKLIKAGYAPSAIFEKINRGGVPSLAAIKREAQNHNFGVKKDAFTKKKPKHPKYSRDGEVVTVTVSGSPGSVKPSAPGKVAVEVITAPSTAVEIVVSEPVLISHDGEVYATSKNIAEAFGKKHHHIIEKIKELPKSFLTSNFSMVQYSHSGNTYDMYEMNRRGFMMLVMSFTGVKAFTVKELFLDKFDEMEEALRAITVVAKTGNPIIDAMNEVYAIGSEALSTANEAFGIATAAAEDVTAIEATIAEATLTPAEMDILDKHKKSLASTYARAEDVDMNSAQRMFSTALKKHFEVDNYKHIKSSELPVAIKFLNAYAEELNPVVEF